VLRCAHKSCWVGSRQPPECSTEDELRRATTEEIVTFGVRRQVSE